MSKLPGFVDYNVVSDRFVDEDWTMQPLWVKLAGAIKIRKKILFPLSGRQQCLS